MVRPVPTGWYGNGREAYAALETGEVSNGVIVWSGFLSLLRRKIHYQLVAWHVWAAHALLIYDAMVGAMRVG